MTLRFSLQKVDLCLHPCRLSLAALATLGALTCPALSADSALDLRRIEVLRQTDSAASLGPQDNAYPAPNRTLSNADMQAYLVEVLSIFALAEQNAAPVSRRAEANQLLRYALNRWPAAASGALVGQYASSWNHRERSLGTRIYFLYRQYFDADILQNFQSRMNLACVEPYNQSSENIKCTTNALVYLAHEAASKTNLSSFTNVRTWWLNRLNDFGARSFSEWGSPYHFWTLGAVQNLAEFALDAQIRMRAIMVVDYTLACMAGFSIDRYFNSSAIRRWYWTFCMTEPHTNAIQTLFGQAPMDNYFLWCDWAASNYRPPTGVQALYDRSRNTETQMTLTGRWHIRSYVMNRGSVSTHQTLVDDYYGNTGEGGETHDIVQCIVQSAGDDLSHVMTYAIQPDVQKYRCSHDRSFGYKNVAIVNGGGFTRKAWAGGTINNVPIRLYRSNAFSSVTFDSGWAFLTDGQVYVAWAPTRGNPIVDPSSATFSATCDGGAFLRSDYTPDDTGEAAVVEVGDPESFGSFTAFQNEIKSRNPRPRWLNNRVAYAARDGTLLDVGVSDAKVNGAAVNLANYPRVTSTIGINEYAIQVGQRSLQYDFPSAQISGPSTRMVASRVYGAPPVPVQAAYAAVPIIPATIQAEDYDRGGEGLGYHDTTSANSGGQYRTDGVDIEATIDVGGGYNVGWIAAGEWLEYTIEVPATAVYPVSLRIAADPVATPSVNYQLELDGVDVTGSQSTPPTTGLQAWKTVSAGSIPMSAGRHILRLTMDAGLWNLNWLAIGAAPVVYVMDFDHDNDVDQSDFAHLQSCRVRFPQPIPPECEDANLNHDDMIDDADVELFLPCLTGANQAPNC